LEKEEQDLNKEEVNVSSEKVNNVEDTKAPEEENKKSEYDELNDRYKRLFAEFENYKKRSQKERENLYGMITGDVVSKILPIMDNLENAANAQTEDTAYQDGVKLVMRQFSDSLKSFNVEEIESVGKKFDPELHEAVSHIEDAEKGEQEIVQEYRKGYKIGNKVIRHSMVIVAN
jgi:molecular chaperone GrpE